MTTLPSQKETVSRSKIVKAVGLSKANGTGPAGNRMRGAKGRLALPEENQIALDEDAIRRNRIILGKKMDPALMGYNLLRTQVNKAMSAKNSTVLAVTSSRPGEGKSTTSVNLALSLSRAVSKDVVLVDFDLHKPTVEKKLAVNSVKGLGDYYLGKASLQDIILKDSHTGLYIIPGKGELQNAGDLIGTSKTASLMNDLKRLFPSRLIILDTPPILVVDDVSALLEYIDDVLFVVFEGKSHKDDLKRSIELIGEDKLLGTVLNNSKESKRESAGYYNYYYKSTTDT